MIDIHVLTYSGTQEAWLRQCLASLADQPCTVHLVQGDEGNVGSGRARGYLLGDHDYVGYVDSDDFLLPGAAEACLEGLKKHRAVVTLERWLWGGILDPRLEPLHHLAVYRREDVMKHVHELHDHPIHCDQLLMRRLRPTQLEYVGYVWRIHAGQGHRQATACQQQAMEAASCA